MSRNLALAGLLGTFAIAVSGCGSSSHPAPTHLQRERAALQSYLRVIEPPRLAVNRLLMGADPTLSAYHDERISHTTAALRMGALERSFASYAVDVAAIEPSTPQLRSLHAIYAHTYVLEDSYLSALVLGLRERDLENLPNTENEQRIGIIQWRTGLYVLARRVGIRLPADLQIAGRGEIAPSPDGS